ncbi:KdsC family phosphatase [Arenicella xantha]|uniref:3-deoxy-D-manno-octulosonate 8-phosphate phosphatase KdsC n=1 Tax=Arenicella xantha TaxID=644221 RepID=A0A395JHU4_9GAMM|nr:HAD hydrolase family protein [Arenicella xantha]RBP49656.1 3-deoxy-D-manno-octulosonate 8-phosphate phosphatase (KDO 8-P phosphatase) [Arenicella xantha]
MKQLPPLPYQVSDSVMHKASAVKLALFDVDGVLTDGKLHYSCDGERVKVFHALDGHGLKMLQMAGIDVGVISARSSKALQRRLQDLGIKHCYLGVNDKLAVFETLINDLKLSGDDCAFTGDDVIDLPVMERCGLKLSVKNGHFIVQDRADWIAPLTGGEGAVRAICDVLLYSQASYPLGGSNQQ